MKEAPKRVTETLVCTCLKLGFEVLPREDVDNTKLVLLDFLGCAFAGPVVDRSGHAIAITKEFEGDP
jgi:hypothetical protein